MRKSTMGGVAATLGLLSCHGLAEAADLPSRAAPPPVVTAPVPVDQWGGLYAGSTYGYGFSHFSTRKVGTAAVSANGSGQTGGGVIGYNFQTGHFVYGAEGSIDLNLDRKNVNSVPATQIDSLYDIRLRGRLGYEFGWFMPFVAGGAVINETYQSQIAPNWFGQNRQSVGWTAGAGVDFKINPSRFIPVGNGPLKDLFGPLIFRLEYLHDSVPNSSFAFNGNTYRTHSDSNVIRAAIINRFGDSPPRPYVDPTGTVNWAGAYGGVIGGGGSLTPRTRLGTGGVTNHFDATGGFGGIYAGTNFVFLNRVVLGFEGSTAYSDIHGTGAEPTSPRTSFRNYVTADLRGRAGYAFGNLLPFVAAGAFFGRSEQIDQATGSQRGRVPSENWTVGGGLDYRVSDHVSLRGEYLYVSSFKKKQVDLNGCDCRQSLDGNIFRVGAAYHFD